MPENSSHATAAAALAGADRVTVLTGAGISTDSGIPDFRGPQGVWTANPGTAAMFDLDTYMSDTEIRRRVWQMRRAHPAWTAEPNEAHRALTELDRFGRLRTLITQNIDGLHQAAGTHPDRVIEVHGTVLWVVCMTCGLRTRAPEVLARLDVEPDPPCVKCGGIQKSDTISFGQQLNPEVLDAAIEATADCDVFLAVGTSLAVYPVAGLCDLALQHGASLIIVNSEPTPYDPVADAVLNAPIGEVLPALVAR